MPTSIKIILISIAISALTAFGARAYYKGAVNALHKQIATLNEQLDAKVGEVVKLTKANDLLTRDIQVCGAANIELADAVYEQNNHCQSIIEAFEEAETLSSERKRQLNKSLTKKPSSPATEKTGKDHQSESQGKSDEKTSDSVTHVFNSILLDLSKTTATGASHTPSKREAQTSTDAASGETTAS